jgi:hypothetical protein
MRDAEWWWEGPGNHPDTPAQPLGRASEGKTVEATSCAG